MELTAVRALVDRAKAKHPELSGQVDKAAGILASRDVVSIGERLWRVQSQEKPEVSYYVDLGKHSCQCVDHVGGKAPSGWCKHLLAASIVNTIEDQQRKAHRVDDVKLSVAGAARRGVALMA